MKFYLAALATTAATGKATEHSYRAAVEALFHRLHPKLEITNEPRRQACGAPDFVVQRTGVPIGYIEAKDLGKDLPAPTSTTGWSGLWMPWPSCFGPPTWPPCSPASGRRPNVPPT